MANVEFEWRMWSLNGECGVWITNVEFESEWGMSNVKFEWRLMNVEF